jgi:hypothetical protein
LHDFSDLLLTRPSAAILADRSGNAHGVCWCLQGFSLTRIVHRCRRSPLLTFAGSTLPRCRCVSRGLFPVRVRCRRPKVEGPIPSWRFCSSRVSSKGHHTAVLPRPRAPSTTFSRSALTSRAEARPTTC